MIREFKTGATRNDKGEKFDYEGFISPIVLERLAEYMHSHGTMENGSKRPSDNWQKGIPKDVYMKSLLRHTIDLWKNHRGYETEADKEELLCAVIFNSMGYLFEEKKGRKNTN